MDEHNDISHRSKKQTYTKPQPINRCQKLLICGTFLTATVYIAIFIIESSQSSQPLKDLEQTEQEFDHDLYESIHDRHNRLSALRNSSNHLKTCDYLSVKGLPYSGTHWLFYILTLLKSEICNPETLIDLSQKPSLCYPFTGQSRVGLWHKSSKTDITERIPPSHIHLRDKEYQTIYRQTLKHPNTRFCQFIVLRDPRDTVISRIYHKHFGQFKRAYKKDENVFNELSKDIAGNLQMGLDMSIEGHIGIDESVMNTEIRQTFVDSIYATNEWWNYYKMKEENGLHLYFTYFYSDLFEGRRSVIEEMIGYIGVAEGVISETALQSIVAQTGFDAMLSDGVSGKQRNGKYCDFANAKNKLMDGTVAFMNAQMRQSLVKDLVHKFESKCPITTVTVDLTVP